jgi:hypothetical protein
MWRTLRYLYLFESICENGISFFLKQIVSWFIILLENDVGIAFLIGFAKAMQRFSKFQKICYGTQRLHGILKEQ